MLQVINPLSLIHIPVLVCVFTFVSVVVSELSLKLIAVKEYHPAFLFFIILPLSLEGCSLREKVFSLPLFLASLKITFVPVLIGILELSPSIGKIVSKSTFIDTAISVA